MRRILLAVLILMTTALAQETTSPSAPGVDELNRMAARFAPTPLQVDTSALSPGDKKALVKLIQAARIVNHIFMQQFWSGDLALYQKLQQDKSALGQARLHYFWINKGPWSEIDEHKAFLPGVPARKPAGANFYPDDMTKEEFEAWAKTLYPESKQAAEGFFTVIRRDAKRKLKLVPYSQEYATDLNKAGALLREAAALTDNATLKKFLTTRAAAFSNNNYYESDMAWMDLDAPVDVTYGPYETYNDEKVVQQKGSKRVMLKNVQEAKFRAILMPISKIVLQPAAQNDISFELFFTHIVAHELTHGLGPHQIKVIGRDTNPRLELKNLYSAIEEAKADVTGLFALQFLMMLADKGAIQAPLPHGPEAEHQLYTTYLASSFRTLRFGLQDAHAKGMAMQFNYLLDRGAYVANPDGTFSVDFNKIKDAVRDLDHDLLTLEARGDYQGAKNMLARLSVVRPEVQKALDRLKSLPTDIEPIFMTADALTGMRSSGEPAAPAH